MEYTTQAPNIFVELYWKNNANLHENTLIIPYREADGSLLFAIGVCLPMFEFTVIYASQFLCTYDQEH